MDPTFPGQSETVEEREGGVTAGTERCVCVRVSRSEEPEKSHVLPRTPEVPG